MRQAVAWLKGSWDYALLILIFFLLFALASDKTMPPTYDGAFAYAPLRSILMDRDLNYANELQYTYGRFPRWDELGRRYERDLTARGYIKSWRPIGAALLWAPWFLGGHVVASILEARQIGPWDVRTDGFSWPYTWFSGTGTSLYGLLGLLLVYRFSRSLFSRRASLLALITIWASSPLVFYMYRDWSFTYAQSMFATTLFLYLWWQSREDRSAASSLALGGLGGLMSLIRPQNALFLALPILEFVEAYYRSWRAKQQAQQKRLAINLCLLLLASLIVFSPQVIIWNKMYGSLVAKPQNIGFENRWSPVVGKVLFSSFKGLFIWQPAALFGVLGLLFLYGNDHRLTIFLLIGFLLQIYLNASTKDWFGGGGFGPWRFINCTLIFVLGYAALLDRFPRASWLIAGAIGLPATLIHWVLLTRGWPAGLGGSIISMMPAEAHETGMKEFFQGLVGSTRAALADPRTLLLVGSPLDRVTRPEAPTLFRIGMGEIMLALALAIILGLVLATGRRLALLCQRYLGSRRLTTISIALCTLTVIVLDSTLWIME